MQLEDQESDALTLPGDDVGEVGFVPPPSRVSVTALHAVLRRAYAEHPHFQALSQSLGEIGEYLDGVYVVFHAGMGAHFYAEEWSWEGFDVPDEMRDLVTTTMSEVMCSARARCTRIGDMMELAPAMVVAPVFDAGHEVVGAAGIVVGPCDRERAFEFLSVFEGVVGYLTLLASGVVTQEKLSEHDEDRAITIPRNVERATQDPLYLAYALAAQLKNRHDLEQIIVGFVRGARVRVVAVCGLDEVRQSNPGVKLVRAAMEECLDLRQPILVQGRMLTDEDSEPTEEFHLHARWSRDVGGDSVASFPLIEEGQVIAVVSVRAQMSTTLDHAAVDNLREEVEPYTRLLPVSRLASRGLASHTLHSTSDALRRVFGHKGWQGRAWLALATLALLWVSFGSMSYTVAVPCSVVPGQPRAIASPRDGVLSEVLVEPGDRVGKGQLLARLDVEDERLQEASFLAELKRLDALIDASRAAGSPGEAKVFSAQRDSAQAQLDLVVLRLQQSEIVAPEASLVLEGDLQRAVGSRMGIGEPLFQLAEGVDVQVELRIPEGLIWDAREYEVATFIPSARPTERIVLDAMNIRPSISVAEGKSYFLARSTSFPAPSNLSPGMEGVVHVEVGDRSVWWILTHRVANWMRLKFWL